MSPQQIDLLIYQAYPRKIGKIAAMKAIAKAVKWIMQHDCVDALTARRRLYKAVKSYADSPAGRNPDKKLVPHPATWFNRGSFTDDPEEWNVVSGGKNEKSDGFTEFAKRFGNS